MTARPDEEIVHRELETDRDTPVVGIAEIVSDLEDVSHQELKTTYEHLDHILEELFGNPPVPEAQVQVRFTYEGYRITVEQDGSVQLVRVGADNNI